MELIKIINEGENNYTVKVTAGGITKEEHFDNHKDLMTYVNALKDDGFIVSNDLI